MEDDKLDMGEAELRKELVSLEDVPKVISMTKEELNTYAHSRLGKKLDLTRRLKMLRLDVVTDIKNKLKLPQSYKVGGEEEGSEDNKKSDKPRKRKPEFIFEPKRRRVFECTDLLAKRTDLIHCWLVDKDGKEL